MKNDQDDLFNEINKVNKDYKKFEKKVEDLKESVLDEEYSENSENCTELAKDLKKNSEDKDEIRREMRKQREEALANNDVRKEIKLSLEETDMCLEKDKSSLGDIQYQIESDHREQLAEKYKEKARTIDVGVLNLQENIDKNTLPPIGRPGPNVPLPSIARPDPLSPIAETIETASSEIQKQDRQDTQYYADTEESENSDSDLEDSDFEDSDFDDF